jgi:hypothetical protein
MILRFIVAAAAAALVAVAVSVPFAAEAKSTKDCQKEWAANKTALTAAGQTQKGYMAECTGKTTSAAAPSKKEDKGGY